MLALARVDAKEGRHADAIEKCRLALPAFRAVAGRAGEAQAWRLLGDLEKAIAEPESAAACYREAEWLEQAP